MKPLGAHRIVDRHVASVISIERHRHAATGSLAVRFFLLLLTSRPRFQPLRIALDLQLRLISLI